MYKVGQEYTRADIYSVVEVPKNKQGGNWATGYHQYGDDIYIFCNVSIAGRTGHDYDNHWEGERLVWFAKANTTPEQPMISKLLSPECRKYIFYRDEERAPFKFAGEGVGTLIAGYTRPVRIEWRFGLEKSTDSGGFTDELDEGWHTEGGRKSVSVNKYERDGVARIKCLQHYGYSCSICGLEMKHVYGDVADSIIHVHHLVPLSEIGEEYVVDPIKDLRPLCPNCHAVVHSRRPAYSLAEVKEFLKIARGIIS